MIYVIRHGQTDLNIERKMQGRMGLPLNEYGLEQAHGLRNELKDIHFDVVFSSPQERAIQTAEIVTGLKAIIDERLDVYDLGEADRVPINEVKMSGPLPDTNVYKGVEDPNCFVKRIFGFMKELENKYSKRELNILISGHRCTTGCMGAFFEGIPTDGNILRFSSDTGYYRTYTFKSRELNSK
ncbi:histidine phosphatase family protein [Sporosarcina saromensis]|uniref:Histidine phosphatase family protein n=1 Tax=Sporosarcina saromensis TaxID=359365 RepID=A0ABU4GER4_9BACL|nr:histidine phosphatase family protein [Sporosarcina saromensis]MDW0114097.1 histidine phosphatase family protein [Sporosarcina saromensis]